jgi:hypothetical protein
MHLLRLDSIGHPAAKVQPNSPLLPMLAEVNSVERRSPAPPLGDYPESGLPNRCAHRNRHGTYGFIVFVSIFTQEAIPISKSYATDG